MPKSDISRTKPLIRNQICRRLTEELRRTGKDGEAAQGRHRLRTMLDEFPAVGRLDFFETSVAFLAGYGVRAFLIAQSLNQIEKVYGEHVAILDNRHVRIGEQTTDEGTAGAEPIQRAFCSRICWSRILKASEMQGACPLLVVKI